MATDMKALLAKLRAKTDNPAGATPVIDSVKAATESPVVVAEKKQEEQKPRPESKLGIELQNKLLSLEQALLDKHPLMPNLLREIHSALRKQPENVVIMNEDEIRILVAGLKIQTGVELLSATVKSGKKASTKTKVSANDLGL